ncbi:dTDP-4-dehydrorhamnose reductase [Evansella halocellulosilytica]|uniref:dTDP-4-dehydrorhamnose reductase n=1 Tax=Evansella halocellulosilytica TaxID=2011013 RepID=UPI000BB94443|nr:dTDP-4-dehydrorhamnose reductase [Evansella halocellulosilytica]
MMVKKKLMITGGKGQLGKELEKQLSISYNVYAYGKDELDITVPQKVEERVQEIDPDIIIHAAAYTAVDHCELDRLTAFRINAVGTMNIALAAKRHQTRLIYISSDYVFNGKKSVPYTEKDETDPLNIYGVSKCLGEETCQSVIRKNCTIVRTSWVFGHGGNNFVNTMLRLGKKQIPIKVVNDQMGSPTYTADLVSVIRTLIELGKSGIYHVTNSESCTWFEFAKYIFNESGYDSKLLVPVSTKEFGSSAPRPHYSVLSKDKLLREGLPLPRSWQDAVSEYLRKEFIR